MAHWHQLVPRVSLVSGQCDLGHPLLTEELGLATLIIPHSISDYRDFARHLKGICPGNALYYGEPQRVELDSLLSYSRRTRRWRGKRALCNRFLLSIELPIQGKVSMINLVEIPHSLGDIWFSVFHEVQANLLRLMQNQPCCPLARVTRP